MIKYSTVWYWPRKDEDEIVIFHDSVVVSNKPSRWIRYDFERKRKNPLNGFWGEHEESEFWVSGTSPEDWGMEYVGIL